MSNCTCTCRTNIGNAKLAGLQKDLHMSGTQYNDALTIFFVSYSVFEPATNVLLKRLQPSVFIPIIMVLWVRIVLFVPSNCSRVDHGNRASA